MTFPKSDSIYEYNGKQYIVHYANLIDGVFAQDRMLSSNLHDNSHLYNFNWLDFALHAKYIKSNKLNNVY